VGAIVVVMLRIDARREQLSGEIAMAHSLTESEKAIFLFPHNRSNPSWASLS
jgi:hypothetical protein